MFAIALSSLETSVEQAVPMLAEVLQTTPYELRIRLAAGLPVILVVIKDQQTAIGLMRKAKSKGFHVVAFDTGSVVSSDQMVHMDHFHFDHGGLQTTGPTPHTLPYDRILAMLRASHSVSMETEHTVKKKTFSMGRALATQGLMMTKTTSVTKVKHAQDREQVLYLFRKDGQTPWLLRETSTKYNEALGSELQPTKLANFTKTIQLLRQRAPGARYDARLMKRKVSSQLVTTSIAGANTMVDSNAGAMDVHAHLLALILSKQQ